MYSDDCTCADCKLIRARAAAHRTVCDARRDDSVVFVACSQPHGHQGVHEGWGLWKATGRSGWVRW